MYSEDLISAQTISVSSHNWRQCGHKRIFYSIKMSRNKKWQLSLIPKPPQPSFLKWRWHRRVIRVQFSMRSLCLRRHYSTSSKQCFTMCNTGNWVAVNKGVRRFWWTKGPRGVLWEGHTLSFSATWGRKSQFPQANRNEWKTVSWCFRVSLKRPQSLLFSVLFCVCKYQSTVRFDSSAVEEVNVTFKWRMAGCWCYIVGLEKVFCLQPSAGLSELRVAPSCQSACFRGSGMEAICFWGPAP